MSNFKVHDDRTFDNTNTTNSSQLPSGDITNTDAFPTSPAGKLMLHTDGQVYITNRRRWIPLEGNGTITCMQLDDMSTIPTGFLFIALGNDLLPAVAGSYTFGTHTDWVNREVYVFNSNGGAHTITVQDPANDIISGEPGTGTVLTFPAVPGSTLHMYVPGCAAPNRVFAMFNGFGGVFTIA